MTERPVLFLEQGFLLNAYSEALTVVICVDHASINGGQAKVAVDSAIGLKRHGHRPIFFAAAGPVAPELEAAGVEVVCLGQHDLLGNPSRVAGLMQGTWNFKAVEALRQLLARLPRNNTIVHVHGWAKALSPAIALPIRASGLPAVYTIHEYFLFCPNGGFYNYQENHACTLEPLSAQCWATHCDSRNYPRKLWRNARLTLAQKITGLPDIFADYIAISAFQKRIVGERLPRGAELHHVSNPVEVPNLGPKTDPVSGDVIFVGRLVLEKGPFLFAKAARAQGIIPTFIGDGPAADELKTAFPEARMLGWQKPDAVHQAMRAARALVFPSLWYEGQPLTVLEAKAFGTPVVVSDGGAGREEVEDGVTGLWFKGGDTDDLARALALTKDDARIAQFSAASYESYWADPPTLDRHIERVTSVYAKVLARRSEIIAPVAKSSAAAHLVGSRP
jgi:glycosyltransferase involved in cell wall biosynthesis